MRRWAIVFLVFIVGWGAACGSSQESVFGVADGGGIDGSAGGPSPIDDGGGFINDNDGGGGPSTGGGASCTRRTCADAKATCGPVGDGCGGLLHCGTCNAPESCGGGGTPSQCGGNAACVPRTCADVGATCGPIGDGCGGIVDCGTCKSPQSCGGGGTPSVCGGNNGCVAKTCAQLGATCGPIGDGCGGIVDCGTCAANQSCGAAGKPSVCVTTAADGGGGNCTPKTCAQLGATCGPQGDGCGNVLDCGTCIAPKTCGGGGKANACGGNSGCVPRTCAQAGATCGPVADGCGNVVQCGTCPANQACGAGGTPNVCGSASSCTPRTCAQQNADCGPVADGCGGVINCGTCTAPLACGGGGTPSKCGNSNLDGGVDAGCTTGLCNQQQNCGTAPPTTISGTVVAPTDSTKGFGNPDPIYNAVVYVPNLPTDLKAFAPGVSCTQCGADVTGNPLVKAFTGPDGKFTLVNAPVGASIPVVIQLGRWRRVVNVNVKACQDNPLTLDQTRFPRKQAEGSPYDNIPLTAISTGNVDTLECVLRKIGIDDSEFVQAGRTGRVQMYQAGAQPSNGHRGARPAAGGAIAGTTLYASVASLSNYDLVLFPCEGGQIDEAPASQQNVIDYTGKGGRVMATHYSYTWLYNDAPFSTTGTWNVDQKHPADPLTGNLDTSFPKGVAFAQWLQIVGGLSQVTPPQIHINAPRHDLENPIASTAQRWIYSQSPDTVQHYTFNTPVGAQPENQCGRVIYSDFHVLNADVNNARFPTECTNAPLSAQEKVLEFMLFDLASCIQPDKPPPPATCTPRTCAQAGANCGSIGDGCGGVLNCGTCTPPQTCGGGGTPSQCGGSGCTPRTCAQAGANCGLIGDGCGGTLDCGACTPPQTCGGGGIPSQCGNPSCVPLTCAQEGYDCGPAGDGCGGLLQCGACTAPQTCGGGGSAGVCGNSTCVQTTCAAQNASCGPVADGCGGLLQCGPCPPGQTCGGGGVPYKCGAGSCSPRTCAQANANCGPIGDGCGGTVDCGVCPAGQTCGGGGVANQCGGGCTPLTCAAQGAECGPAGDGCGGQLDCGTCTAPDTCGGGGVAFKCGHPLVK